ncbi:MAG TPA: sugar phosphate isomerase/epimerase family protein [Verrucomicrobiae bacterium]
MSFTPPITCRLEVLPGESVAEKVINAQRFGFAGIALPGRFLKSWLDEARAFQKDSPLPFVSLSLGFEGSLLNPNAAVRQKCHDSILRLLDICAEFKAHLFNIPPVLIQDNPERLKDRTQQDDLFLEQLPALGDAAKARGVTFLIEPVNRYESDYLHSIEHAAQLCAQLNHPAIALTADFYHMQLEELHADAALTKAGVWTKHVHVAENTRVEPGPGTLNFSPGFKALKQLGYRGLIEVECRTLSGSGDEVLPKSVVYLQKLWQTT